MKVEAHTTEDGKAVANVYKRLQNGRRVYYQFVNDPPYDPEEGLSDWKRKFLVKHAGFFDEPEGQRRVVHVDSELYLENGAWVLICFTVWDLTTDGVDTYLLSVAPAEKIEEVLAEFDRVHLFDDEASLAEAVVSRLVELDFDIATGWNPDFDMVELYHACQRHNLNFKRLSPEGYVRETTYGPFRSKRVNIAGRDVFDLKTAFQKMAEQLEGAGKEKEPSYTLRAVAKKYLGMAKPDYRGKFKQLLYEDPRELLRYNRAYWENGKPVRGDVLATVLLDRKFKIVQTFLEAQAEFRCELQDGFAISSIIDLELMRIASKIGVQVPRRRFKPEKRRIQGPLNIEPSAAVLDNAATYDYSSLYPTIAISWNMSPETADPNGDRVVGNGVVFTSKRDGLVKIFLQKCVVLKNHFSELRDKSTDPQEKWVNTVKRNFYKLAANATIGVMASDDFRWYSPDVAGSVYFIAREVLSRVRNELAKMGLKMHYGHTDSCTIELLSGDVEKSAVEMERRLNEVTAKFAIEKGLPRSEFVIKLDRLWKSLFLSGGHNRYAGYLKDGSFAITATFQRAIMSEFGKEFVVDCIKDMLDKKVGEPVAWAKKMMLEAVKKAMVANPLDLALVHTLKRSANGYKRRNTFLDGLTASNTLFGFGLEPGESCFYLPVKNHAVSQLAFPMTLDELPKSVISDLDWVVILENNIPSRLKELEKPLKLDVRKLWKELAPEVARATGGRAIVKGLKGKVQASPADMSLADFMKGSK
jgi:DNA polymerase elongation subunit (family B)